MAYEVSLTKDAERDLEEIYFFGSSWKRVGES